MTQDRWTKTTRTSVLHSQTRRRARRGRRPTMPARRPSRTSGILEVMKIDIKIESSGFPDPDKIVREAMEGIAAKARREYCSEHKQHAKARVVKQGRDWAVSIEGCCEDLAQRAQRRAAGR